jgi:hypothetical protein
MKCNRVGRLFIIPHSSFLIFFNFHMLGLFASQGQVIATEAEFDGVAEGCSAHDFDLRAVAESHLQKPAAKILVPANGLDATLAADAQRIQIAGIHRSGVAALR